MATNDSSCSSDESTETSLKSEEERILNELQKQTENDNFWLTLSSRINKIQNHEPALNDREIKLAEEPAREVRIDGF